jgi:uncharacterized membrane protein (UPF0127 family)
MNLFLHSLRSCAALLLVLGLAACGGSSPKGQPKLPTAVLHVGPQAVTAELADTAETMSMGLMFRESLGENEGMLFVYQEPRTVSFWMKNTRLPLSIGFIDPQGTLLEVHDMQPFDTNTTESRSSRVRYALEMNQGWFEKHKLGPGSAVTGLPR